MLAASGVGYPLPFAPDGATVVLVDIRAGRKLRTRLCDLGLVPGQTVRVVQAAVNGPLIVAVQHDTRLALGRGMAQKIIVHEVQEEVA